MFRENVAAFAKQEIAPLVSQMDARGSFDSDLLKQFFELGLMGIEIPESLGGAGASFFMSILAVEELSKVDPSAGVICDVQNTLINNALIRWGNDQQKQHYLPRLAREWVGAYALSEAGSGSDAFRLSCQAVRSGDGFVLNGQKSWITNASEANLFIIFATVDKNAGYRGITAFLVEADNPGLTVGPKEDKLGIRASSTCQLLLDNCLVPEKNVLGEVGKGYKIAIETLNEGRIGIGAQMVGLAQGAVNYAIDYAGERQAFGRFIREFQGVQFPIARVVTEIEAARLLVYNAARLKDDGKNFVQAAAMAKYFSSEVAEKAASLAIEIYGGYGYTRDYPVEKYYRDAKIGKIYEGTTNMQLSTIARCLWPSKSS
ncbi:MAG TPA: acyl-CoA dehydrogenase [Acidobacteriota bacterium]|nr:acyl-CoA dehydrogenase [Acidobacteriota bacterium]